MLSRSKKCRHDTNLIAQRYVVYCISYLRYTNVINIDSTSDVDKAG